MTQLMIVVLSSNQALILVVSPVLVGSPVPWSSVHAVEAGSVGGAAAMSHDGLLSTHDGVG